MHGLGCCMLFADVSDFFTRLPLETGSDDGGATGTKLGWDFYFF